MNDNKNVQQYFLLWKNMIEFLAANSTEIQEYQQWNKIEY